MSTRFEEVERRKLLEGTGSQSQKNKGIYPFPSPPWQNERGQGARHVCAGSREPIS
jgi:hypothetical protein